MKAETMVMKWPFFSSGCASKGGKVKFTFETVFHGLGSSKVKATTHTLKIWFSVCFMILSSVFWLNDADIMLYVIVFQ